MRGRRVYVIEIQPPWYELVAPGLPVGRRCFYVGETGKDIAERYREHRTGEVLHGRRPKSPAQVFAKMRGAQSGAALRRRVDVVLRRTMSDRYPPAATPEEAGALEAQVVDELRRAGHAVYPKGVGSAPFEAYRADAE